MVAACVSQCVRVSTWLEAGSHTIRRSQKAVIPPTWRRGHPHGVGAHMAGPKSARR
jgi:hypothetical protein